MNILKNIYLLFNSYNFSNTILRVNQSIITLQNLPSQQQASNVNLLNSIIKQQVKQNKMSNNLHWIMKKIYQKINNHLTLNPTPLIKFWTSQRLCQTFDVFNQMLINIDFYLNEEQLQQINQHQLQFITLQNLIQNVAYWKEQEQSITTYISKKQYKEYKRKQLHLPLQITKKSQTNESVVSSFQITNKKHLAEHAKKQLQDKIKLSNTLRTVKNQSDYALAVKIGEANDICTKLKNGIQYFLNTTNNNQLQIIYSNKSKVKSAITLKKFERHYQNLKLVCMNQGQQIQGTLEDDLKKVLVEVMCLSSHIKKQTELLKRKGISY